ncbi:hypothetical protein [Actinomycetospora sp. NBRC 106378]|uniref:hypothetical protein n=1 Tax=Actinomycetospora sp. NBRC 106378 TaxID=3032208 RepID=UPI0024A43B49|nr:hypothetical protein [Actinomycetospora sp. NBRC 106378]GLZ54658.1 hypothetical protein Acsp07_42750 [Actinomycetospora sp. NBRC 106378]
MSPDVDALRPTPIFDEVDRWARHTEAVGPSMLTFRRPTAPAPGTARTVLALLAAAREERTPRHALRRS